ncbi:GSCOCG00005021001-RA-CDS [Cotesia congregata]|uniref:Uncharacterized protein n=1 Tax=Cotesia congregata TaxID=51543 RepID=A0A8J2E8I2_COTCN|nr:GSCOCG00005021001-RA-CDS [Cotesia congregata]CAG5073349.1 Protein of unknown function [Cotesia congregata]
MNSFFVSVYHYLHDMYVENSKIMIVLGSKNNFYFSQTDIQNGSNEPRVISLSQCKQIFHFDERIECKAKIKIHNSYVVTAYSERDFCIALKTETQNEEYDFVTKSIQGVNTFLHISNCVIKFDVMFILTQEGSLIFYKFKNINHLIDIDLLTNQAMAIETGSEYSLVKLMMRNLIPYTLIICEKKDIILLTF